jgi:pilus assembly protein CpaE
MKIAIVSPSPQSLEDIAAILEQGNPSRTVTRNQGGISRLAALAEQERPNVIIVEGLCHDGSELAPIEYITTHYPQMIVIMLCSQQSSEFLINAMRVGVREVLPSPVAKVALEAAISRLESKLGLSTNQRRARIVALVPCKGGAGATFLATNLGYQMAAEGKKVLLIDLNLQFGEALLTVHDRKATTDIVEVARNVSRLDASFLSASSVQVLPNFEVLDVPVDPAQSLQFKPEHLDAILNVASGQYDFVIMDLNRNLDDVTIKALDRSHSVFLVVQLLLPYLRNATRLMTVFRSLGYSQDKTELIVNRHWKNGEIGLDDLRTTLGLSKARIIPNGYKEVSKAINQGEPLVTVAKSSPVVKAIAELAQSLAPKEEQAQSVGLLRRLLKH